MKRIGWVILSGYALFLALSMFAVPKIYSIVNQEQATDSASPNIEYTLPYPGILPDHPLYPLKVLRDRILLLLIIDPLKKAEFSKLLADKRLNMGIFLIDKGKPVLAESTISKGEKYLLQGTEILKKTKVEGAMIPAEITDKFILAAKKHQEIIYNILQGSPEEVKEGYEASFALVKQIQEDLHTIK